MDQMKNICDNITAEQSVSSTPPRLTKDATGGRAMADVDIGISRGSGQSKPKEIWKPVPSEPGVLASSWGRILLPPSYAPMVNGGYRAYSPKPRYGQVSKADKSAAHEFRIVLVKARDKPSRQRTRKVHQLVCEAFHGPRPFAGAVVIHKDEDSHNNRPENLKWGTQKENLNAPGHLSYLRNRKLDRVSRKFTSTEGQVL